MCFIWGLPRFAVDLIRFRKNYEGKMSITPCLHDRHKEGGATKSEYFWQDLLVAQWLYDAKPLIHVDIGSRVDGFVAHVASFREIEVIDIREMSSSVPGIIFKQADLMSPDSIKLYSAGEGYCDSLSCLHAVEHFGLGRYGDVIDCKGYAKGIANMSALLKKDGIFYLSTPIGEERVEFNSHRVFSPRTIIQCARASELDLIKLTVIDSQGCVREVQLEEPELLELEMSHYHLGIFIFRKKGG